MKCDIRKVWHGHFYFLHFSLCDLVVSRFGFALLFLLFFLSLSFWNTQFHVCVFVHLHTTNTQLPELIFLLPGMTFNH